MKKRFLTLLAVLCIVCCLTAPALAADTYIMDDADLLSNEEEQTLLSDCMEAETTYACGVYIVTVQDFTVYGSNDPYEAATKLYTQYDLGVGENRDGILLMLSMAERDYSVVTHGYYANAVFDNSTLDEICSGFLSEFRFDDWYNGFASFTEDCLAELRVYEINQKNYYGEDYQSYYNPGTLSLDERLLHMPESYWLVVLLVPPVIALVVVLIMKRGMRTAGIATRAGAYIPKGGVDLRVRQDAYTHTTTRVIHHESNHGSGGGGGGFSGRSGKF